MIPFVHLLAILNTVYASQNGISTAFVYGRSIDHPLQWDTRPEEEILLPERSGARRNVLRSSTKPPPARTKRSNIDGKAKSPLLELPQRLMQQQSLARGSTKSPTPHVQVQGQSLALLPEPSIKSSITSPATQEVKQQRPIKTRLYATNPMNPGIEGWGSKNLKTGIKSKTAKDTSPATAPSDDKNVRRASRLERRGGSSAAQTSSSVKSSILLQPRDPASTIETLGSGDQSRSASRAVYPADNNGPQCGQSQNSVPGCWYPMSPLTTNTLSVGGLSPTDDSRVPLDNQIAKRGSDPYRRGASPARIGASLTTLDLVYPPSPKRLSMKDLDHALASYNYDKIAGKGLLPGRFPTPIRGHASATNMADQPGRSMTDSTKTVRSRSSHGNRKSVSTSSKRRKAAATGPKKNRKTAVTSPTNQNAQHGLEHGNLGRVHDNQVAVGVPLGIGVGTALGVPYTPFTNLLMNPGPVVTLPTGQNVQHGFGHDNNQHSMAHYAPIQRATSGSGNWDPAVHPSHAMALPASQNVQPGSSPNNLGTGSGYPQSSRLRMPSTGNTGTISPMIPVTNSLKDKLAKGRR